MGYPNLRLKFWLVQYKTEKWSKYKLEKKKNAEEIVKNTEIMKSKKYGNDEMIKAIKYIYKRSRESLKALRNMSKKKNDLKTKKEIDEFLKSFKK